MIITLSFCSYILNRRFPFLSCQSQCTRTQNTTSVFGDIEYVRDEGFLHLRYKDIYDPSICIHISGHLFRIRLHHKVLTTIFISIKLAGTSDLSKLGGHFRIESNAESPDPLGFTSSRLETTEWRVGPGRLSDCVHIRTCILVSRLVTMSPVFATRF